MTARCFGRAIKVIKHWTEIVNIDRKCFPNSCNPMAWCDPASCNIWNDVLLLYAMTFYCFFQWHFTASFNEVLLLHAMTFYCFMRPLGWSDHTSCIPWNDFDYFMQSLACFTSCFMQPLAWCLSCFMQPLEWWFPASCIPWNYVSLLHENMFPCIMQPLEWCFLASCNSLNDVFLHNTTPRMKGIKLAVQKRTVNWI